MPPSPTRAGRFSHNSYKPFACGLVVHPVIDGCIQLRNRNHLTADMIDRVEVGVHPRVMLVTAIKDPKTGLEGKFSVYHAAAVALVDGAAGEQQFSDEAVRVPAIVALRRRVVPTVDPTVGKEQARVAILLKNGERLTMFVEHAVGSVEKPHERPPARGQVPRPRRRHPAAARPTRSSTSAGAPTRSPTPATSPARRERFDGVISA